MSDAVDLETAVARAMRRAGDAVVLERVDLRDRVEAAVARRRRRTRRTTAIAGPAALLAGAAASALLIVGTHEPRDGTVADGSEAPPACAEGVEVYGTGVSTGLVDRGRSVAVVLHNTGDTTCSLTEDVGLSLQADGSGDGPSAVLGNGEPFDLAMPAGGHVLIDATWVNACEPGPTVATVRLADGTELADRVGGVDQVPPCDDPSRPATLTIRDVGRTDVQTADPAPTGDGQPTGSRRDRDR